METDELGGEHYLLLVGLFRMVALQGPDSLEKPPANRSPLQSHLLSMCGGVMKPKRVGMPPCATISEVFPLAQQPSTKRSS